MNRRRFFQRAAQPALGNDAPVNGRPALAASAPKGQSGRIARTEAGLAPYTGAWGFTQAAHLLRRATFGVTPQVLKAAEQANLATMMERLFAPETDYQEPINYNARDPANTPLDGGGVQYATWVNGPFNRNYDAMRFQSLTAWWTKKSMIGGDRLLEKMVLFWHNHFATEYNGVNDARYMYRQNQFLRENAFGNFRTLLKGITLDAAMLRYLNGNTNTKASPNENYGRELQELFSIGKGPEIAPGNYTTYTEDDVKAVARVLTGWKDDQRSMGASFVAEDHDTGNKQFSAAYGNRVIQGRGGAAGAEAELDELLDMILEQEATALYLCRKLYTWFVYDSIDAAAEENVIVPLAAQLRENDYELRPVVQSLLSSEHFFDEVNIGCIIKSPMDHVLGVLAMFQVELPSTVSAEVGDYYSVIGVQRSCRELQMDLLNPPNVAGWPAYYQEPAYRELWINAVTLQNRLRITTEFFARGFQFPESRLPSQIDCTLLAQECTEPGDAEALLRDFVRWLFPLPISDGLIDKILALPYGDRQQPWSQGWPEVWQEYISTPPDEDPESAYMRRKGFANQRLRVPLGTLTAMAEYQLS